MTASGKTEAIEIIKNDPYVINGVAEYSIIEFEVKSFAEGFREFVKWKYTRAFIPFHEDLRNRYEICVNT